eukprot:scaffold2041_cov110-Isochrysis_galbana.AAC.3
MAAGALRGLVCVFLVCCLLLVPGTKECPQALQDDAGREMPECKGFRKSQVGSVSQALCASNKQVQGR